VYRSRNRHPAEQYPPPLPRIPRCKAGKKDEVELFQKVLRHDFRVPHGHDRIGPEIDHDVRPVINLELVQHLEPVRAHDGEGVVDRGGEHVVQVERVGCLGTRQRYGTWS